MDTPARESRIFSKVSRTAHGKRGRICAPHKTGENGEKHKMRDLRPSFCAFWGPLLGALGLFLKKMRILSVCDKMNLLDFSLKGQCYGDNKENRDKRLLWPR